MARGRLFGLLLVLLEQLAAKQPLVLVIEDVHWADRSTGELVKVLGAGDTEVALRVTAHAFSASAREKLAATGGTVTEL